MWPRSLSNALTRKNALHDRSGNCRVLVLSTLCTSTHNHAFHDCKCNAALGCISCSLKLAGAMTFTVSALLNHIPHSLTASCGMVPLALQRRAGTPFLAYSSGRGHTQCISLAM